MMNVTMALFLATLNDNAAMIDIMLGMAAVNPYKSDVFTSSGIIADGDKLNKLWIYFKGSKGATCAHAQQKGNEKWEMIYTMHPHDAFDDIFTKIGKNAGHGFLYKDTNGEFFFEEWADTRQAQFSVPLLEVTFIGDDEDIDPGLLEALESELPIIVSGCNYSVTRHDGRLFGARTTRWSSRGEDHEKRTSQGWIAD